MATSDTLPRERTTRAAAGRLRPAIVPIEIVLAYHQTIVRSGLRMLLNGVLDFVVIAEVADSQTARPAVRARRPRVLVLDLDQPDGSTIEAIPLIRAESPWTQIVVMSVRQDLAFVSKAIEAGALGYVPSSATAEELMEAVRRAASGQKYLSHRLHAVTKSESCAGAPNGLSSREIEVLRLIALGYTNTEIALQLALSVRTIETHRSHIRQKLELPTRAELAAYAFAHGIGS